MDLYIVLPINLNSNVYSIQLKKWIPRNVLAPTFEFSAFTRKWFESVGIDHSELIHYMKKYETNVWNKIECEGDPALGEYGLGVGIINLNKYLIQRQILSIRNLKKMDEQPSLRFDKFDLLSPTFQYAYGNVLQEPEGELIRDGTPGIKKILKAEKKVWYVQETAEHIEHFFYLEEVDEPYKFVGKLWYSDAANLPIFSHEIDQMLCYQHEAENENVRFGAPHLHKQFFSFFMDRTADYYPLIQGELQGHLLGRIDFNKVVRTHIRTILRVVALFLFGLPAHWRTMGEIKKNVTCFFDRSMFIETPIDQRINRFTKVFFLEGIFDQAKAQVFVEENNLLINSPDFARITFQGAHLINPNEFNGDLEHIKQIDSHFGQYLMDEYDKGKEVKIPFVLVVEYMNKSLNNFVKNYKYEELQKVMLYNRQLEVLELKDQIIEEEEEVLNKLNKIDTTYFTWDKVVEFFLNHLKDIQGFYGYIAMNQYAIFQELAHGNNCTAVYKTMKHFNDLIWEKDNLSPSFCANQLEQLIADGITFEAMFADDMAEVNQVNFENLVYPYTEPSLDYTPFWNQQYQEFFYSTARLINHFQMVQSIGINYAGYNLSNIRISPCSMDTNYYWFNNLNYWMRFNHVPSPSLPYVPAPAYETMDLDAHDSDDEPILKKRKFDEMEAEEGETTETEEEQDNNNHENSPPASKKRKLN